MREDLSSFKIVMTFPKTEMEALKMSSSGDLEFTSGGLQCDVAIFSGDQNTLLKLHQKRPALMELADGVIHGVIWPESIENLVKAVASLKREETEAPAYMVGSMYNLAFSRKDALVEVWLDYDGWSEGNPALHEGMLAAVSLNQLSKIVTECCRQSMKILLAHRPDIADTTVFKGLGKMLSSSAER